MNLSQLSRDNRLLALSMLLWGMGEGLFIYIQPLYLKQLGAQPADIGGVLALNQFLLGVTFIPAGWLADRFGHRRIIIAGWAVGLVATCILAFARDLRTFVVGLMLYAVSGFVIPVISSYATAARGRAHVEQSLATVYAAFALGSVPSPTIGGWIGERWGLSTVYQAALAFMAASTLTVLFLRNQRIAAPVQERALYRRELWQEREFVILGLLTFIVLVAMWLPLPLAPNFLQDVRGLDVSLIGILGTIASLGGIVLQLRLGRSVRPRHTLAVAQGLMLVAVLLLWQSALLPFIGVAYFLRASVSLARLSVNSITVRVVQHDQLGLAYGAIETIASLAFVAASYSAGALYTLRPEMPFIVALAALPLMIVLTAWLAPRAPAIPPTITTNPE